MEFHQSRVGKTSEVKAATREEDWRTMFPAPTVRIVNWNLEWAKGNTPKGRAIQDRIAEIQPNVACLTQSHTNFYATGSVITSDADYGYGDEGTRRKVVLWKAHWDSIFATDFTVWTRNGLVTFYVLVVMHLKTSRVHIAGITPSPNAT